MRGILASVSLVALLSCTATSTAGEPVFAPRLREIDAVSSAAVGISREGFFEERIVINEQLPSRLMNIEIGDSLRLVDWPVSPGDHRTLTVARVPVYAAGARVFELGEEGAREVPRSRHRYSSGRIEGDPGGGVLLILDPALGSLAGITVSGGSMYDLEPLRDEDPLEMRLVSSDEKSAISNPHWSCGGADLGGSALPAEGRDAGKRAAAAKAGASLEAVLAIDTDTELLSQKFGGSTSAATDYIADLIAAMNVMYERDLGVTLLQGNTFLRTSSDPYESNSGGAASTSELFEFRSVWNASYGSVPRALAAMLSGKSPYSNSASGIAFIGGLCSSASGYSFSKVFKISYLSGDARLVGHEIGHNFGSPHTHCYSPPIDTCWNECGYTGPTSCPGGPGTVMSYCHLLGCGTSLLQFHPRVIDNILANHVGPATGVCVFETAAAGIVFFDGFESGGIGAWSGASP